MAAECKGYPHHFSCEEISKRPFLHVANPRQGAECHIFYGQFKVGVLNK